jgi:hypothetical protein
MAMVSGRLMADPVDDGASRTPPGVFSPLCWVALSKEKTLPWFLSLLAASQRINPIRGRHPCDQPLCLTSSPRHVPSV